MKETTLERPFITVLDLGIPSNFLLKQADRVKMIIELMKARELEPANEDELREALRTHPHPGFDLISLAGEEPFFAVRSEQNGNHEEIRLVRSQIVGRFQWFAVKSIH